VKELVSFLRDITKTDVMCTMYQINESPWWPKVNECSKWRLAGMLLATVSNRKQSIRISFLPLQCRFSGPIYNIPFDLGNISTNFLFSVCLLILIKHIVEILMSWRSRSINQCISVSNLSILLLPFIIGLI